ncbi:hypothetical protein E3V39_03740 [Gammaproteobacteria bacterium LSUCC0112]|nr:hypothetical protein E3V39_03740 [Gammaproteobacteria bacterium LSUCC0112]
MNVVRNAHTFNVTRVEDIYNLRFRLFQACTHLAGSQSVPSAMAAELSTVCKTLLKIAGPFCSDIDLTWHEGSYKVRINLRPKEFNHNAWPSRERLMAFHLFSGHEGAFLQKSYELPPANNDQAILNDAWQMLVNKTRDELFEDVNLQNDMLQREISQRIAAQQTLVETQRDLIENEKLTALGGLVAGISHEINTPVGICVTATSHLRESLVNFIDLYQSGKMKRSDLDVLLATVNDLIGMLEVNLNRACELVRSFKAVAVDQTAEDVREFVLADYIKQVVISLRPKLRGRKIELVLDGIDSSIALRTTPGPISQILVNLITNSLVHGFDEEQAGVISISAHLIEDTLNLTYSDNGKGILPENIDKIFDPFFTTKRSHGGSGLGMHLVHNIVTKKFSGKIKCESTIGRGVIIQMSLCGVLG